MKALVNDRGARDAAGAITTGTTTPTAAAQAAGGGAAAGTAGVNAGTGSGSGASGAAATSSGGGPVFHPNNVPIGPGVSATEIKVGFMVTKNLQAAFATIGAEGQPPDEIDLYKAMVKWANDHGGLGGRRIVPVFAEVDATGNWQAQGEAVCATFTQDNRVAAAVSSVVGGTDALVSCLAPKGVPLVEQNHWLWDQTYWQQYGKLLYQPSRMRPNRSIPAAMKTLAEGGFFSTGHRLGLVRFDAPVFQRLAAQVMKPSIAANGGNLVDEVAISSPGGVGDFGGMSAQLGNAILRLRSNRVSHVLFLENAGILPFFWNHEANSQQYYPRLGLLSYDSPYTQQTQDDPKVLKGSLAAGWAPALDVIKENFPPNRASTECASIMKQQGLPTDYGFGFYHSAACDALFFLKTALDRAPALTADGLRQSVESLGTSYQSPYTFPSTSLGPGRHDGATMIALAAYEDGCQCYKYIRPPVTVP